jgi:hypothetical protein
MHADIDVIEFLDTLVFGADDIDRGDVGCATCICGEYFDAWMPPG